MSAPPAQIGIAIAPGASNNVEDSLPHSVLLTKRAGAPGLSVPSKWWENRRLALHLVCDEEDELIWKDQDENLYQSNHRFLSAGACLGLLGYNGASGYTLD